MAVLADADNKCSDAQKKYGLIGAKDWKNRIHNTAIDIISTVNLTMVFFELRSVSVSFFDLFLIKHELTDT
jgi:hypothetical protein